MSAKHALLGLLLERPTYRYDLAARLQGRLGPTWGIRSGHLYQTIERMEAAGLIEPVDCELRGERRVYRVTESGRAEFESWFAQVPEGFGMARRPLQAKLSLASPERLADVSEQIEEYARSCAKQLEARARERDSIATQGPRVFADEVMLRLGLSADVFALEAELRWAAHALEKVRWLAENEAVWPAGGQRSDRSAAGLQRARTQTEMFARIAVKPARPNRDQVSKERS